MEKTLIMGWQIGYVTCGVVPSAGTGHQNYPCDSTYNKTISHFTILFYTKKWIQIIKYLIN
jgi:hypothetical protein